MNNILLRQLKNQLQSRSVNSVKYIYPEELLDMIGCDDHRAEQFIIWLNAERLLKYIYVVNCKCGETVYVHENRLFILKMIFIVVDVDFYLVEMKLSAKVS